MVKRASQVIALIDATTSFGTQRRIEKVEQNRKEATVSCLRHLCFGEEKMMKFSKEEMVFYRLKIRSETMDVAELKFMVVTKRVVRH